MKIQCLVLCGMLHLQLLVQKPLMFSCSRLLRPFAQSAWHGSFHDMSTSLPRTSLSINVFFVGHIQLKSAESISVPCQCFHGHFLIGFSIRPHTMPSRRLKVFDEQAFQLGIILNLSATVALLSRVRPSRLLRG